MAQPQKKKWSNWLIVLLMVSPFVGIFTYGFYTSSKYSKELEENAQMSVGKVVSNYRIKSRGDFIVYQFYVDNKLYVDHQPVSESIKEGTCFKVKYSAKSPDNCEILLNQIIPCD